MRICVSAMTRLILLCLLAVFAAQAASLSPAFAASLLAAQEKPDKNAIALQRLLDDIGKQRAAVIDIQRELVSRPALNPEDGGEGEEAKARWIEKWLIDKGLPQAERIDVADERVPSKIRPNLIIRYLGAAPEGGRTLWIVGHLDTSPPGALELWTGSPYALRIVGDTLYGNGVEDNHQAITSGLVLMEAISRNRVTPPLSFGLVLTAGEKSNYPRKYGIDALLQARPDLFRPGDLVIVNDYGNATGSVMEVAEKGSLWLKFIITGKQAHSATPQKGLNALDAGANLITDLRALYRQFPEQNALFEPPTSTFIPTRTESGSVQINQMPGEYVFYMDCRLISPYTADAVQKAARALADAAEKRDRVTIRVEREQAFPAFPGTPPDAPVVQALSRAVRAELGVDSKPIGIGGITLAADLRGRGIPTVVWAKAESMSHGANESISITSLLDASKIFARILFDTEAATAPTAPFQPAPGSANQEKKP